MNEYKEKLEKLYTKILDTCTLFEEDSNGLYLEYCPYCREYMPYIERDPVPLMTSIFHNESCIWLEARKYVYPEEFI